jgi:gliding motility-associated lipoprotein GldH
MQKYEVTALFCIFVSKGLNMRRFLFIVIITVIGLSGCSKRNIYREFHKFDNYTWNRFDKVVYNMDIKTGDVNAEIILSVRYLEQFPYEEIPIQAILNTPSGEERIIEHTIKIKDEKGNFKGEVAGSYWDLDEVLWKSFYFNQAGKYSIEIENINPYMGIPGIVDLGLTVKRK